MAKDFCPLTRDGYCHENCAFKIFDNADKRVGCAIAIIGCHIQNLPA